MHIFFSEILSDAHCSLLLRMQMMKNEDFEEKK